ncbi:MAG: class I SAM-dependent methyltransferase [Clostridiales bacterium]|nr:class I SAM-dependent methyltransferase [Clostridiales bacterium]
MKKLNARLSAMAGFVGAGESVADIGADHGYLPMHLVGEGVSPFAILTDANPGPLEKTRVSVTKAGFADISAPVQKVDAKAGFAGTPAARYSPGPGAGGWIELRLGDGLSALARGEVDTVVIAGMGGETIVSILAADPEKARSFGKYILQPRTKTGILRAWVSAAGWKALAETQAEEQGRFCDIIVCTPEASAGGK